MNLVHVVIVAFVSIQLNGLFLGLAVAFRKQAKAAFRDAISAHRSAEMLREELLASRKWNAELRDANTAVQHLVTSDPMQLADELPQRSDPLEQAYRLPSFTPQHERGQQ